MKKIFLLLIVFSFFIFSPIILSADTGPKPSTIITIKNLKTSDYLVGIAAKHQSGPHVFYDDITNMEGQDYQNLSLLNAKYVAVDEYKLLDICIRYNDTNMLEINSGYMWPSDFKLLIYDINNDVIYTSSATKTYYFHSYFTCDFRNVTEAFTLNKNYQYGEEVLSFFIRLIVTLAIEFGIALLFFYDKKSYVIIFIINVITQIGLNLFLNLSALYIGKQPLLFPVYILIELVILVIEGIIYKLTLKKRSGKNNLGFLYATIANLSSFIIGVVLWFLF